MQSLFIPPITFREEFKSGYTDPFVKQLLMLQDENYFDLADAEKLQKKQRHNLSSNMIKEKALSKLVAALNDIGIEDILLVKGGALLQTLFKDYSGIRPMSDIDLILKKKDYKKVLSAIKENRFINRARSYKLFHMYRTHEIKFEINNVLIEIHDRLVFHRFHIEDYTPFFNDAETVEIYGKKVLVPTVEHQVVLYLLHNFCNPELTMSYRHLTELYVLFANCDFKKLSEMCFENSIKPLFDFACFLIDLLFEQDIVTREHYRIHWSFSGVAKGDNTTPLKIESPIRLKKYFFGTLFYRMLLFESIMKPIRKILSLLRSEN